jgi:hypothetical protein
LIRFLNMMMVSNECHPPREHVIPGLTRDPRGVRTSAVVDCGSSPQ